MNIRFVKNSSNRYDLYDGDNLLFSLSEEDYLRLSLYEKTSFSEGDIVRLRDLSDYSKAKSRALDYLSYKLRTSFEVERIMKREGYGDGIIDRVISELKSEGYINDLMYVKKYVYDRSKQNPKAGRMLEHELKARGVDPEIIEEGLLEFKIDNTIVASELIGKKYKNEDLSDPKIRRKIYLYLRYRGFRDDEIKNAIKRKMEDIES